jgi:hypothetical protein
LYNKSKKIYGISKYLRNKTIVSLCLIVLSAILLYCPFSASETMADSLPDLIVSDFYYDEDILLSVM